MSSVDTNPFSTVVDLAKLRRVGADKNPLAHQRQALDKLHAWFDSADGVGLGGLLVLPTGAGKTFTAARFLASGPLSRGYKLLWLAHTHHLLDQAYHEIARQGGAIVEPRATLALRVISGMPGHCRPADITAADDVLVCTIQTIARALNERHPALERFLESAGNRLAVVFDEAHHTPAYSYRTTITELRKRFPKMVLLGLTATPTYSDEKKRGWLQKLFPQGILCQVHAKELMAAGVLAKPRFEEARTKVQPQFDDREYHKWRGAFGDLPEELIQQLSENQRRNDFIVSRYISERERYGKTIIFTDRWFQCEYLREALDKRGVRVDAVYSHVDADPGSAEARNRRTADENSRIIREFKEGKLDVLVNVRMLTEGTDCPKVQTVFLTRQTTSAILANQMVGRALRGPRIGGTEEAIIVSFIDEWRQLINWAGFPELGGGVEDLAPEALPRPPLHLISIDLVRRLARQMDSGVNIQTGAFLQILPVGWYLVEFSTQATGTDDLDSVRDLVLVFDHEQGAYSKLISQISSADLADFAEPRLDKDLVSSQLKLWQVEHFGGATPTIGENLNPNLLAIARHMAQQGEPPRFFAFEERSGYDLDRLAEHIIEKDLGPRAEQQTLEAEYKRSDRYWRVLYPSFYHFRTQYDACKARLLMGPGNNVEAAMASLVSEPRRLREPSEDVKRQVKRRDGYRCVCCGEDRKRLLQVDHVAPSYLGGDNALDNLQTLCRTCNNDKNINEINYRTTCTPLDTGPSHLPEVSWPKLAEAGDADAWERFLRRQLNTFYRCYAVEAVTIGRRGDSFYNWRVTLFDACAPSWLEPHLADLLLAIRERREEIGKAGPDTLTIEGTNGRAVQAGRKRRRTQ